MKCNYGWVNIASNKYSKYVNLNENLKATKANFSFFFIYDESVKMCSRDEIGFVKKTTKTTE